MFTLTAERAGRLKIHKAKTNVKINVKSGRDVYVTAERTGRLKIHKAKTNIKNECAYISICRLCMVVPSILYATEVLFCFWLRI